MAKKKVKEEVKEEVKKEIPEESKEKAVAKKTLEKSKEKVKEEKPEETKKAKKKSGVEIKLFNRWSFEGLVVNDPSLLNYINLTPIIIPHSGGKHEHKRFWKTERVNFVERFINKLMAPGLVQRKIKGRASAWNSGKKQKLMKIIENAFVIVEQKTQSNPLQVLIDALIKTAPREETTRISLGGISYQTAVDIAPQRRVDLAVRLLVQASVGLTYNKPITIDECIANEIINASKGSQSSRAIRRKDEIERIAISAR